MQPGALPPSVIPTTPQPAPVPPQDGSSFQPWEAVPDDRTRTRYDTLQALKGQAAFTWASVPPMDQLSLYNPGTAPVRGMFSSPTPAALKIGEFALLQNVRYDDASIQARYPTTDRNATGLPAGSNIARGMWADTLNGTTYVIVAAYDGAKVGIYESTDGVAFTTATATSGAFGDSRLTDTGIPVTFCRIRNRWDASEYLVIQNGTDDPRIYSPSALYSSKVRVHKGFTAPAASALRPLAFFTGGAPAFNVGSAGNWAFAASGAHLTGTTGTTATAITISVTNAIVAADTLTLTSTAVVTIGGVRQLLIAADQAFSGFWDNVKVEIGDGVNFCTLSDPGGSTGNTALHVAWTDTLFAGTAASGGLNGEEIVAFDLGLAVTAATKPNFSAITKIRLTWATANAVAVGYSVTIHGMWASGSYLAFDQSYALSYGSSATLAESPATVMLPPNATATYLASLQGTTSVAAILPYSSGLYYDYFVPIPPQSSTDLGNGADQVKIYRKDFGGSDYFLCDTRSIGTYSAGWLYKRDTGGTYAAPGSTQTFSEGSSQVTSDPSHIAPDAYCQPITKGTAMVAANGRLYVAGQAFYALSEYDAPMRFRALLAFDSNGNPIDRSASTVTLAGEKVQAFAAVAASALGASTVVMFTDRTTYTISGFDAYAQSRPTSVARIGCSAPQTVQAYKDAIFFLDDSGQQRRFSYTRANWYGHDVYQLMVPISRRAVDDRTRRISQTRLPWACGFATLDRYYLAYTPVAGSDNTKVLVWDDYVGGWVEDTVTSFTAMAMPVLSGVKAIIALGSNCHLYTHENSASSTGVAARITTGALHDENWKARFWGRLGMVCDVQAGQTATITKSYLPGSVTDATTMDMATSATGQVWRYDNRSGAPGGLSGVSCQIDIQMTMVPATHLHSLIVEHTSSGQGPDV